MTCAPALDRGAPRWLTRTYPDEVAHRVASRPVPDGDTWVRSALAQLGQVPGVRRVGLALAEGGGRRLLFSASDRDNESSVDWCEVDAYEDVPLNHSVRTGEAVVGSLDDLAGRYPAFTDRQSLEDPRARVPPHLRSRPHPGRIRAVLRHTTALRPPTADRARRSRGEAGR